MLGRHDPLGLPLTAQVGLELGVTFRAIWREFFNGHWRMWRRGDPFRYFPGTPARVRICSADVLIQPVLSSSPTTPGLSRTMQRDDGTVNVFQPALSKAPSTPSLESASASVSKCAGQNEARTSCCKPEPEPSMAPCAPSSSNGIRHSNYRPKPQSPLNRPTLCGTLQIRCQPSNPQNTRFSHNSQVYKASANESFRIL